MRMVYIEWIDSYFPFPQGWQDLEDVEEEIEEHTFICKSIGFLYTENSEYILILQNLDGEDERASGILKIPKKAVTKMEDLIIKSKKNNPSK